MKIKEVSVFVSSVKRMTAGPGIIVEASNGGPDGPPFIRFELQDSYSDKCYIGKRYIVTIEEASA